jgi:hypothetical protein
MKNKSHLIQQALQHRVAPEDKAWLRLEDKLSHKPLVSSKFIYRFVSYAAVCVAVLAVITIFILPQAEKQSSIKQMALYRDGISSLQSDGQCGIYEISKLNDLKMAYKRLNSKSKD